MFNWLLEVVDSGVVSDIVSPDNIPDGIAGGLDFDTTAFVLGVVSGVVITLLIIGILKYIKFIIKDNKEMQEKLNSKKSDE